MLARHRLCGGGGARLAAGTGRRIGTDVAPAPFQGARRRGPRAARATETTDASSGSGSGPDERLRSTMADLDALLGVVEDDKPQANSSSASTSGPLSAPALERAAADAAQRIAASAQQQQQQRQQPGAPASGPSSSGPSNLDGAISDQMKKILERAKALADQQQQDQQQQQQQQQGQGPPAPWSGNGDKPPPPPATDAEDARAQQEALRAEFEQLLDAVFATSAGGGAGGGSLSEQDEAARRGTMTRGEVARLRACGAFGPTTFWVTEVRCLSPEGFVGPPVSGGGSAPPYFPPPASPAPGGGVSAPPPSPPSSASSASASASSAAAAAAAAASLAPELRLSDRVGVLVRGNLRARRADVFRSVQAKVAEAFGGRYEVLLVPDPDALLEDEDGGGGPSPQAVSAARARAAAAAASGGASAAADDDDDDASARIAFHVVPAAVAQPPASSGAGAFQLAAAAALLGLLIAACVQLALVANVAKLPAETLRFFADPDAVDAAQREAGELGVSVVPPGLDTWDPRPYVASALPVALATLGVTLGGEAARRAAALARGVRLGPTYFIPNLQIGSFGAVTSVASLLPSNKELWDVAAAGPLTGFVASGALLAVGLAQSHLGEPGALPAELLVPVPAQLLQGSLLLGTLTRAALGDGAAAAAAAAVQAASAAGAAGGGGAGAGPALAAAIAGQPVLLLSPLAVAGWCGAVTTALNLLPVGSLDGGRMFQAAYGRQALALSSFFTYAGLGLGLIGSSLSLPFGIYVLVCRRSPEKYVRDSVTPVASARRAATAAAVLAAILVLLPVAPEVADQVVGVGGSGAAGGGFDAFF